MKGGWELEAGSLGQGGCEPGLLSVETRADGKLWWKLRAQITQGRPSLSLRHLA